MAKRIKLFKNTEHLRTSRKCPLKSELLVNSLAFYVPFKSRHRWMVYSASLCAPGRGKGLFLTPTDRCTCPAMAPARRLRGRVGETGPASGAVRVPSGEIGQSENTGSGGKPTFLKAMYCFWITSFYTYSYNSSIFHLELEMYSFSFKKTKNKTGPLVKVHEGIHLSRRVCM